MQIIGQEKILSKINSMNLDTFPHSLILEGKKGSGKHTISEYIAEYLKLSIIDISENISLDTVYSIQLEALPKIYLIDINKVSERNENAILKILEEPGVNNFLIILCETLQQVLSTIKSRCQVWRLQRYSEAELKAFAPDWFKEEYYKLFETPGSILSLKLDNIDNLFKLSNTIVDKIGTANYSNTLSIMNKLAFEDEEDLFNLNYFLKSIAICLKDRLEYDNPRYYNLFKAFRTTQDTINSLYIKNINKKYLIGNYLTKLKIILS